jgi:hypothetical protein
MLQGPVIVVSDDLYPQFSAQQSLPFKVALITVGWHSCTCLSPLPTGRNWSSRYNRIILLTLTPRLISSTRCFVMVEKEGNEGTVQVLRTDDYE